MFLELSELNTYEDLKDYLLGCMDYADDSKSNANPSFTKNQHWDSLMGDCMNREGNLPARTKNILLNRIKKDFPLSETD